MAGLLAARALAPHARRVSVLERDASPDERPGARKGVPQGDHAHVILRSGLDALQQLFPGIERELEAVAGPPFDVVRDTAWKIEGAFRPRFASRYQVYGLGRPALERIVRRRVAALPNVVLRPASVSGLERAGDAIRGVRLTDGTTLGADLVVDASGRGTRVPAWLEQAGFERPEARSEALGLSYTSCIVEPTAGAGHDFRMLLIPPSSRCARGGLLVPLECGRYLATLITYDKELPPLDWDGFRAWAARADDPLLGHVLAACRPVSARRRFAIPRRIFHRYDRLRALPRGLLAIGDAICSFDPAFGQGMSVCALEARALEQLLARRDLPLERLTSAYFARAARLIAIPWAMRRERPERSPRGERSLVQRLARAYRRELLRAAANSPALHLAFLRVVNLEAPPSTLFKPGIALEVMAHGLGRALSSVPAPATDPA